MQHVRLFVPLVASFTLFSACSPTPTAPSDPVPASAGTQTLTPAEGSPAPTAAASSRPQASSIPSAPVTVPSAAASASASTIGQASSSPVPPTASALPLIADASTFENTTLNGKVFDLDGNPLDEVRIVIKSLSSGTPFQRETTTRGGSYSFNNVPSGVQLEILASKDGYSSRRRVEVLKSNKSGDPQLNRYDFGTDGSPSGTGEAINALSDSPEVIKVSPVRNASGIAPTTSFSLTFSEPMERESVEDTFSIRAYGPSKLTVDAGGEGLTFAGAENLATITNPLIYDADAFDISWSADSTQVTFSFKDEQALPTDTKSSEVPGYQVVFNTSNGRTITDASGKHRNSLHFRLSDTTLEESYRFNIKPDTVKPSILQLSAVSAETGNDDGDALRLSFSEPMIYETLSRAVAGGLEDRSGVSASAGRAPAGHPDATLYATERNAAANYTVFIDQGEGESVAMTWAALGGSAIYDPEDESRRTVLLTPPAQLGLSAAVVAAAQQGDTISAVARLKDGSSSTLDTLSMRTQSLTTADHVAAGVNLLPDANESLTIVYTDGSSETAVNVTNPAANTYASLLSSVGALTDDGPADWTITELQGGGAAGNGNVEANDRVDLTLAADAARGGKPIAWIELGGGIFASNQLNQSGYRIVTSPLRALQAALNAGFATSGGRFSVSETDLAGGAGIFAAGDQIQLSLGAGAVVDGKSVQFVTVNPSGVFASNRLNAPAAGFITYPGTSAGATVDLFDQGDLIEVTVASTVMDPAGNTMDTSLSRVTETAN